MGILSLIFNGIVAVGNVLVETDEKLEKIERKINHGRTIDESLDEVERNLLGGRTIEETVKSRRSKNNPS